MTRLLQARWFSLLAIVPGMAIWELLGRLEVSFFLPPLSDVLLALGDVVGSEPFMAALADSLTALAIGFLLATSLGIIIGLLMGIYPPAHWALNSYIDMFMSAPKVALIPVFVLLIGFGQAAVVTGIFLYVFFPMVVNTLSGVEGTSTAAVQMAQTMGASRAQIVRHIVLPSAAPMILGGLRLASGRAIKGLIIGEQLIAVVGVGALLQRYAVTFQIENLYAMVLLIGFAGVTVVAVAQRLEIVLLPWAKRRPGRGRSARA